MLESNSTAMIRKSSIEELCGHRDRSIDLIKSAMGLVESANAAAKLAAPDRRYGDAWVASSNCREYGGMKLEAWRRDVDRACWRYLLDATNLGAIMGAKQKAAFDEALEKDPPEFTVENAYATFADKAANADKIFAESVVNAFRVAPKDFKSNDAFKVGARMILEWAYSDISHGWTHSFARGHPGARDIVSDLDRIMHILDGRNSASRSDKAKDEGEGDEDIRATDLIADAMREARGPGECETRYFRIRWFKKGTAHVWFLRPDLVRRMNEILASEYGLTLGDAA